MSLLKNAMIEYKMLVPTVTDDGLGGQTTTWAEGQKFKAAVNFAASRDGRTADRADTSSNYVVTTSRDFALMYHDVFKRIADGKIFRVTSDGDDRFTPLSAMLDMRQVEAEEWQI